MQKALGCRIAAPEQSCAHFVVGVPGNNFCVLFCIGPAFTVFTDAPVVPNVPPLPTKQFLTMDPAAAVSAKADGSSSATPSCTPTRRAEGNDQFIGRGSYGRQEVPNTEARPHSHPEDRHRLRKKSRPSKASRGPPPPPAFRYSMFCSFSPFRLILLCASIFSKHSLTYIYCVMLTS